MRDAIAAARLNGPVLQPDGTHRFEFRFSADDPTFAGHFPGHPLLPGVYQLEITRASAEWTLGIALTVLEIAKAKFVRPILPDDRIVVALKLTEAEGRITARAAFSVDGQPAGESLIQCAR